MNNLNRSKRLYHHHPQPQPQPGRQSFLIDEAPSIQSLVADAKSLYESTFLDKNDSTSIRTSTPLVCTVAPGRVNLIGEHTDYTQGFVFPMAIDYSTVCIGTGRIHRHRHRISKYSSNDDDDDDKKAEAGTETGTCQIISQNQKGGTPKLISFHSKRLTMRPLPPSSQDSWTNYVAGVVQRYMDDVLNPSSEIEIESASANGSAHANPGDSNGDDDNGEEYYYTISFQMAINGNVPLGSGLSSSAALEVAVATFIEQLIHQYNRNTASANADTIADTNTNTNADTKANAISIKVGGTKEKALLCQKAENIFCNSPCGIMDQYVSAAGLAGTALLIDCRSLEYENVEIGGTTANIGRGHGHGHGHGHGQAADNKEEKTDQPPPINNQDDDSSAADADAAAAATTTPVFVICNSKVTHSIGGGEYPKRVAQCKAATDVLVKVHGSRISTLRDATLDDVERIRKNHDNDTGADTDTDADTELDDLIYRRAKHVVTENERTQLAKIALTKGDWVQFGKLMNASHESMKVDYEVSCDEIDILVEIAQQHPGVFGSRLTGGGFGGCTVTLVEKGQVESLCKRLREEYMVKTGKECLCFETRPGDGAREIIF